MDWSKEIGQDKYVGFSVSRTGFQPLLDVYLRQDALVAAWLGVGGGLAH